MNYWILDTANETNNLAQVQTAAGIPLVALVSEWDGGIIAYGRADVMEACAEAMNDKPDDWDGNV